MKIIKDKNNFRKHSSKNKKLIKSSLEELGAGRSILIDSQNEIIAGNGVYEQADKLDIWANTGYTWAGVTGEREGQTPDVR